MRKKPYTSEEIAKLEANPYTLQATSHRLQLTLEAKGKVLEMLEAGFTASKILRNLGYDTEMLGQASVDGLVYGVKKQARSVYGLHEGYKKRQGKRLESEDIGTLPVNAETVVKLINEVAYLRQEVEFLKKVSSLGDTKKRGGSR